MFQLAQSIDLELQQTQEHCKDDGVINLKKSNIEAIKYAYDIYKRQKVHRQHPEVIVTRNELPDGNYDSCGSMESVYSDLFRLGVIKKYAANNKVAIKLAGTKRSKYVFDNAKLLQLAKGFIKYPVVFSRTPQWFLDLIKQCMASADGSTTFKNITTAQYRTLNPHIDSGYVHRSSRKITVTQKGIEAYTYFIEICDKCAKWKAQCAEWDTDTQAIVKTIANPSEGYKFQKRVLVYSHTKNSQFKYVEIENKQDIRNKFCCLSTILDKVKTHSVFAPKRPVFNKLLKDHPNTSQQDFVLESSYTAQSLIQVNTIVSRIQCEIPAQYFLNSTTRPWQE